LNFETPLWGFVAQNYASNELKKIASGGEQREAGDDSDEEDDCNEAEEVDSDEEGGDEKCEVDSDEECEAMCTVGHAKKWFHFIMDQAVRRSALIA
jgi:hypothetical protein